MAYYPASDGKKIGKFKQYMQFVVVIMQREVTSGFMQKHPIILFPFFKVAEKSGAIKRNVYGTHCTL